MKAFIYYTSDLERETDNTREFKTLDELMDFIKECEHPIIIDDRTSHLPAKGCDVEIEIYDDWRE